jgi:chorismate mutase
VTVRAVRGAIQVDEDAPACVLDATERLIRTLLERNGAEGDDLISMLFTVTEDITSAFPAEAARRIGLLGPRRDNSNNSLRHGLPGESHRAGSRREPHDSGGIRPLWLFGA